MGRIINIPGEGEINEDELQPDYFIENEEEEETGDDNILYYFCLSCGNKQYTDVAGCECCMSYAVEPIYI